MEVRHIVGEPGAGESGEVGDWDDSRLKATCLDVSTVSDGPPSGPLPEPGVGVAAASLAVPPPWSPLLPLVGGKVRGLCGSI